MSEPAPLAAIPAHIIGGMGAALETGLAARLWTMAPTFLPFRYEGSTLQLFGREI